MFGLASVVVLPRADEEQTAGQALVEAVCGGVIAVGETVVVNGDHGEAVSHAFGEDLAFARGYAGADKDGTVCRLCQATLFLFFVARGIFAVADHWQAAPRCKEGPVAKGVAHDEPASQKQAAFDGCQCFGGCQMGRAFALQESAEGGGGERGGDAAALHGEQRAVAHAQQAAARVALDVGALGCQLRRINGHDIAIARGEEGRAAGGARGGHLIRDGQTAAHSGSGSGGAGRTAGCSGSG